MQNDIIKFIGLKDENIKISKIEIKGSTKFIHIEKILRPEYCTLCNSRMHSKGIYRRIVNHPILQDGFQVKLVISQRKWKCTSSLCKCRYNDTFTFIEKHKQSTNITPYMILYEMKDLSKSASEVATKFHVSDTYVHYTFLKYINLPRLHLPKYLSIDEVFLDFDKKNRYSLVLMDFYNGEIVDILPNRNDYTTEQYFFSISKEERDKVQFIICDMYNPYINYTVKYFHNASAIVDAFHVIQWLNKRIIQYINKVKKRYQERDNKQLEEKNNYTNMEYKTTKVSREVYMLNNYRWLLLMNQDKIHYSTYRRYNRKLRMHLDTYDLEKSFFSLDDNFLKIRNLKEKYISFNNLTNLGNNDLVNELDNIIRDFSNSDLTMFRDFSDLLSKYKTEIINSFMRVNSPGHLVHNNDSLRRLSNGPMEGFNRKPKDLKRNSRGFSNFYYTRNRILWSNRLDAPILAIPRSMDEVKTTTNKKRGSYIKK